MVSDDQAAKLGSWGVNRRHACRTSRYTRLRSGEEGGFTVCACLSGRQSGAVSTATPSWLRRAFRLHFGRPTPGHRHATPGCGGSPKGARDACTSDGRKLHFDAGVVRRRPRAARERAGGVHRRPDRHPVPGAMASFSIWDVRDLDVSAALVLSRAGPPDPAIPRSGVAAPAPAGFPGLSAYHGRFTAGASGCCMTASGVVRSDQRHPMASRAARAARALVPRRPGWDRRTGLRGCCCA